MGCLCSREAVPVVEDNVEGSTKDKNKSVHSVQLVAPSPSNREGISTNGPARPLKKVASQSQRNSIHDLHTGDESRNGKHQQKASTDIGQEPTTCKVSSLRNGAEAELAAAGWPSWLTSVAAESVYGLVPRKAESFKKLNLIGRGTYSSVYKGTDLETGKTVAMKKVRFSNMDPESVRFMAREINIIRKLDHPNIIKLEGLVTSRISGNLYLIFEYMEHDLAGLLARPDIKLTEPQVKCYVQQLFRGLEHCHSRGILHRDIKGSNLLISENGILKIGDFGLANFFQPDQQQPLTSRVVTLWYRAPELLLGATKYGVGVDLWSAGCILAELFAGEPILPARTEVEQLHKILKLCGSPPEDFWKKAKLSRATSFKPQFQYKRRISEKFKNFPSSALSLIEKLLSLEPKERGSAASALKSEFFTCKPLPCKPSSLPKYPPSKEIDAKLREEESRKRKAETVRGRGPESVRRGSRDSKAAPSPEFRSRGDMSLRGQPTSKYIGHKFHHQEDGNARGNKKGFAHSSSMVHPSLAGDSSWFSKRATKHTSQSKTQNSSKPGSIDLSNRGPTGKDEGPSYKESLGHVQKKNRMHCSGPLVPPGGNIDDMLREHEIKIQQAVRKAHVDRTRTVKIH